MKKIRVLIIDEHPVVCQALAARLGIVPSLEVVGALSAIHDGVETVRNAMPDVVLLELKGKTEAGLEALAAIPELMACSPGGVIVLTSYLDEAERKVALEAGARRYLLKDIDTLRLIDEIEAVAGEAVAPSPFAQPCTGAAGHAPLH